MNRSRPIPRAQMTGAAIAALLVATLVVAGSAAAGHLASDVKSYTGCLAKSGGTLTLIREGSTPAKPCPAGSTEAHFGGGDITGVTAGTGLTGGGTNGTVTLSLDPQYALRQDCASGQVVKWNGDAWLCAADEDTTYTAGEGLALDGTEFSLAADVGLPDCSLGDSATMVLESTAVFPVWGCQEKADADQACDADEFVNGINETGRLECSSGGGVGGGAVEVVEFVQGTGYGGGVGIPDDGTYRPYASASLGAGTWMFVAKGTLTRSGENEGCPGFCSADDPPSGYAVCRLTLGGVELDRTSVRVSEAGPNDINFPFAVTSWDVTQGGTVAVECAALHADGVGIRHVRGIAVRLGT